MEGATQSVLQDLEDGRRWGKLGLRYEANALPKQALLCYEQAHQLEPRDAKWPYRAGVVSKQNGQLEVAVKWIERSLALDDSYATSYQRIADAQLQLGRISDAKANYQIVTAMDAKRPEAWAGLAKVALQEDRLDDALTEIRKARDLDSQGNYWKLLHGNILVQLGREEEALPLLQAGQGSKPQMLDPWSQSASSVRTREQELLARGMSLEEKGDYSGAIRSYRELIVLRPGEARLPHRLARTLLKAKRNDEALQLTETTLEQFPTHLELMVLRGALLQKAGNGSEAWKWATLAVQHHPDRPDGYLFRSSLLASEKRLDEALIAAKKALELSPNDDRARETTGSLLAQLGRIQEAIQVLEPPLYEDGIRPALPYFQLLGRCLTLEGHSERVQKMVQLAREIHGEQVFRNN